MGLMMENQLEKQELRMKTGILEFIRPRPDGFGFRIYGLGA